jgi:hypothetical protein
MSARLITLAINIALMGFLLLAGILTYLRSVVDATADTSQWHAVAAKIAAGNLLPGAGGISSETAHAALVHGFGWVMLYGGLGAWLLAAASFLTFGPANASAQVAIACTTESG